ncbi:MAG: M20/M25/M40 family metallo-hydrolase, partial [Firmicutes bacterium]|nr:M20/M25/M40 family metallo-hydrolase [Bacillota bacterium]
MNRASDLVREVLLRVRSDRERQLEDLIALCRAESVSTWHLDLRPTAEAVAELMERCGVEPRIVGTRGQPVVIGRTRGRTDRTVVFYNHYDVQPPDPLEAWQSPPFEPAVREGRLYARGVADNKGNLVARLEAVRAWNEVAGAPPVSVAFVVEGEEETGSPHLREVVQANAGWLSRAYGVVWEAGYRDSAGRPTVALGVKGILYLELRARGARSDLHSSLATLVPNPAWRLVWALSTIKDEDEHILVDGFYDAVRPPTQADLELLRAIPDTSADMARQYGLGGLLCGVKGLEANRRNFYEPTATVCGLESGYTG